MEVNILIFCFGISVAYLVTLGDIITPLDELCFGPQNMFAQRWVLMMISCGTIMLPLSLMKDISSLQFSSILGVLSIIFLVIAVAIRSVMYTSINGIPGDVSWTIDFSRGPDFMLSVPIVMFAFTCQVENHFVLASQQCFTHCLPSVPGQRFFDLHGASAPLHSSNEQGGEPSYPDFVFDLFVYRCGGIFGLWISSCGAKVQGQYSIELSAERHLDSN